MKMTKTFFLALVVVPFLMLSGCGGGIPKDALTLSGDSLELRQLQTRSFDTSDERSLLTAAAGVLQDLDFAIDESEIPLGVIVGSKDADATEGVQYSVSAFL